MALIDDDQVEEIGRIVAEEPGAPLVLGKRLIDGEVHFAAFDDLAGFDLVAGVTEGGEGLVLRVIDEDVAVGKIEDAGLAMLACRVPAA